MTYANINELSLHSQSILPEPGLRALGVEAGGEVMVAANSGIHSGTAIGTRPVYADIDLATFNIILVLS